MFVKHKVYSETRVETEEMWKVQNFQRKKKFQLETKNLFATNCEE